jgi:hypothetical protein
MDLAKTADAGKAKKSDGTAGVTFDESPYTVLLQFGADLPLDSSGGTLWRFGAVFVPDAYFGFGVSAGGKAVPAVATSFGTSDSGLLFQVAGLVRAQLPIRGNSFAIVPYAGLSAGLAIDTQLNDDTGSGLFTVAEGGVQLGFGETPNFYLGSAYRYYLTGPTTCQGSAVALWLGFGF